MAALDLNTVRKNIEQRLSLEFKKTPPIPIVFNNMPFKPTTDKTFVLSEIDFSNNEYITLGGTTGSNNLIRGQLTLNIFTKSGVGIGANLVVGTRLRNLFNRIIDLEGIYFEPPNGPTVLQNASPEGYFQSRITIEFQVVEQL
tara:strand:+ start:1171 stop:1599 length:429 start_codon:yes stop_codon:yes gene_type:complete